MYVPMLYFALAYLKQPLHLGVVNFHHDVIGVPVDIKSWGTSLAHAAASRSLVFSNVTMDALLLDPIALPDLNMQESLLDLTRMVIGDAKLDWTGVHTFYRDTTITERGKITALPLGGLVYQMYYRWDVLQAAGLPAPKTWDELVKTAARYCCLSTSATVR